MTKVERTDPSVCCVCSRQAIGHGIAKGNEVLWCCDDYSCLSIARETANMKQEEFTRIEAIASTFGGDHGGEYLDTIGKTDLASLTTDEWQEFCRRIVAGYRVAMTTELKNAAPF